MFVLIFIIIGLVATPVAMYTATQDNAIHFNQFHKEDNSRIKYKKHVHIVEKKSLPQISLRDMSHWEYHRGILI